MSEKLRPQEPAGQDERERVDEALLARAHWVVRIAAVGLVLDILAYVFSYLRVRQGQLFVTRMGLLELTIEARTLFELAGLSLTLALLFVSWLLLRRRRIEWTAYLLMAGVFFAYAPGEAVWSDKTILNLIAGILLILAAGALILPRKWWVWAIAILLYLGGMVLVNRFSPFRTQSALASWGRTAFLVDIIVTALVTVVLLRQVAHTLQAGSIRTRLLVSFLVVVAVPLVATLVVSVWAGQRAGQQQAIAQLASVATLKEAVIDTWLSTLETDLKSVATEEQMLRQMLRLLQSTPTTEGYDYVHDVLQVRLSDRVTQLGRFDYFFILDTQGIVLVSTDPTQEGQSYRGFTFFRRGLESAGSHLTWEWANWWLDTVQPITNERGTVIGVLAGRADFTALNEIMTESTGLGETGETYLISHRWAVLTPLRSGQRVRYVPHEDTGEGSTYARLVAVRADGSGVYRNYIGRPVVGAWRWLEGLEVALIAEQEQGEAYRTIYTMLAINVAGGLIAALFAVLVSLLFTRSIALPLADLSDTASRIAAGDLSRVARVGRADEIGALAQAFNAMTAQLRGMLGTLERQVAERTEDLRRRTRQLEASAQVAREAAAIRDVGALLDETVRLISEQFGFYHAGIFLLDDAGEYAVLQAASSEGGQRMLARGHKLKVGQVGIVGYVAGKGEPRIALDVGEDAVFFDNPDLPDTRSEMALPLRVRGRVIGVLDVQSREPAAFSKEDIAVLETLADQVALAIENARLLEESRQALTELEALYGRQAQQGWVGRLGRRALAYRYSGAGVEPVALEEVAGLQEVEGEGTGLLRVPILLRNLPLGTILLRREEGVWSAEEVALARELGVQIGLALENARLLDETQRRAAREEATRQTIARIRETLDLEEVLKAAVREIHTSMGIPEAAVHLVVSSGDGKEGEQ